MAGQNVANTRDQAAESLISAANASQLKKKWSLTTAGDVTATPTMMNSVLYFPDIGGMLWAVGSAGKVIWSHTVASYTGIAGDIQGQPGHRRQRADHRGWLSPQQAERGRARVSVANGVVYAGSNASTGTNMYALDASTGAILWSFASGGEVRSGAAIVGAKVYWGSGYQGGHNNKLYAFGLPAGSRHGG